MKILRYLLYIFAALLTLFIAFLIYATLSDFRPADKETVYTSSSAYLLQDSVFTTITWNIGYGGLDHTMDFFYDGGEQVRPGRKQAAANTACIMETLDSFRGTDFILLQEVDKDSRRSHHINQHDSITGRFPGYHSSFGVNYRAGFIPIPLTSPMGGVHSGLQTLSAYLPGEVVRHSFPGNYSWPMGPFMLDRCFLVNRYPLATGKELLIINTHNSAYDDGSLRSRQMEFLREFILAAYHEGHYVFVGGDWNQTPHGFVPGFPGQPFDTTDLTYTDPGYPKPGWTWAYDPSIPTNRRVKTPYTPGETPVTMIDFFLLSPNLELMEVQGTDLGFRCSDHQPVSIQWKIR